jgi:hypothetical protein
MSTYAVTQSKARLTLGGAFASVLRSWTKAAAVIAIPFVIAFTFGEAEVTEMRTDASPSVCSPSTDNNFCAPVGDMNVATTISVLENEGKVCSSTSVLTDSIVFQFKADKTVKVVGFDEALALAKDNKGWVQSFCK